MSQIGPDLVSARAAYQLALKLSIEALAITPDAPVTIGKVTVANRDALQAVDVLILGDGQTAEFQVAHNLNSLKPLALSNRSGYTTQVTSVNEIVLIFSDPPYDGEAIDLKILA